MKSCGLALHAYVCILLSGRLYCCAFHSYQLGRSSASLAMRNAPFQQPDMATENPLRDADFAAFSSVRAVSELEVPVGDEQVPSQAGDAIIRFFFGPDRGPICVVIILCCMIAWRLNIGSFGPFDLLAFSTMVVFWWFQEHFLHGRLLHSQWDWMGKEIHRKHHEKPYHHISIDPVGLMLGWFATAHVIFRFLFPLPIAISATLGYASAGLFYEWAHFFVHTRVKPPNTFWKKVRGNHVRHHLTDERYWLSFSVPAIDDIFRTNPSGQPGQTEKARNVAE